MKKIFIINIEKDIMYLVILDVGLIPTPQGLGLSHVS